MLAAQVGHLPAGLRLSKETDDLLLTESTLPHVVLLSRLRRIVILNGRDFGGQVRRIEANNILSTSPKIKLVLIIVLLCIPF